MHSIPGRRLILSLFLIFLLLPIYWLVNMSFKTNYEIVTTMTLWPHQPTIANYMRIFTDASLVLRLHQLVEICRAQYHHLDLGRAGRRPMRFRVTRFLGDKQSVLLAVVEPDGAGSGLCPAVFSIFIRRSTCSTRHGRSRWRTCIFNVPLAVWILEGFVSGVPREIDETAFLDGYSFPRFFITDTGAVDRKRHRRRRVFLLQVLLGRIAAGAHADLGGRQADFGHHDAHRLRVRNGLGTLGRGRRPDHHSRRAGDLVCPQLQSRAASRSAGCRRAPWKASHGWPGRRRPRFFFALLAGTLAVMTWLAVAYPEAERVGNPADSDDARRPACSLRLF